MSLVPAGCSLVWVALLALGPLLGACQSGAKTIKLPEQSIRAMERVPVQRARGKLRPATPSEVRSVLASFPPDRVEAVFLSDVLSSAPFHLRLVDAQGVHRALESLVSHAGHLVASGLEGADFALDSLDDARSAYQLTRTKLGLAESQKGVERLERQLLVHALRLELHAWRVAAQVFELLSVNDKKRYGGWTRFKDGLLNEPESVFARLSPPAPGYHTVAAAYQRYKRLVHADSQITDDEWPQLLPGDKSRHVASLRERLGQEGLNAAATVDDSRWGAGLGRALRSFQTLHSLPVTGRLDGATLRELNVPYARRVAQLGKVLHHMRTAATYREPTRLVVNIPAFRLSHVEGGRLVSVYKVIVGAIARDRQGRVKRGGRLNTTPLIAGRVSSIVLNPSWHVPPRIKEQELDVLAMKDPSIYDSFRLYVDDEGRERAVQRPGPNSALGKVKLSFPNAEAIFLHDTPRRELFQEHERAFSHGCIRVENAVALALSLLERDPGTLEPLKAKALLETNFETPIALTVGVPLFLEYVTAGAAPDGSLRFYPDIYDLGHVQAARWVE